ncbi:hypothetical protein HRbin40_01957 [bacterium HR40]|nr:hypothetical protein HRbin40_01957 [bacterium HR40]
MRSSPPLAALGRALRAAGFRVCGAFHPEPEDAVPPLAHGSAQTLVLVGNAGPTLWRRIRTSPEATDPHPFDAYTRRVVGELAHAFGAVPVYPWDGPPWHPFQRWAKRAEPGLGSSPLGMLVHPRFGLWHAYRAALLFPQRLDLPPPRRLAHPCASCDSRPCLAACPASALRADGYDVPACRRFLRGSRDRPCLAIGCLARHACPVGRRFAYDPAQAAHHMRAFAEAGPPREADAAVPRMVSD